MKNIKLATLLCSMFTVFGCSAQQNETKKIEKVITAFSKAGDENDAENLAKYLADDYRVVMNRLFGSKEVSILPKSVYLDKIKSKEYGGDVRILTIENVLINGTTASAKVTFKGTKITFVSLIILVKDLEGNWKLISDVPMVK